MEQFTYENLTIALVDEREQKYAVVACDKEAKEVYIPALIDGKKVVEIAENAFEDCEKLEKVRIEEVDSVEAVIGEIGLKEIGGNAFSGCAALKEIILPDTVCVIGWGAFRYCTALERAEWSEGAYIAPYAFTGCKSLREISKITIASEGAFSDCVSLEEVCLAGEVKEIEEEAFARAGLKSVVIPASVKSVHYLAFRSCRHLEKIFFEDLQDWRVKNRYHGGIVEVDVNDPVINAKRLAFADFDDGPMSFFKR